MKKEELKDLLTLTIFEAHEWEEEARDLRADAKLDAAHIKRLLTESARITDKLIKSQRLNDKRADEIRILTEAIEMDALQFGTLEATSLYYSEDADMSDWRYLVEEERKELRGKASRLEAFNGSAKFRALGGEQRVLLELQLRTMHTYLHILALRLEG